MFGIGITEIILILIVALVIVGPEKLPELARTIAKGFNEFKRTTNDLKRTIDWSEEPSRRTSKSAANGTPYTEKVNKNETEGHAEEGDKPVEEAVEIAPKKATAKKAAPKKATPKKATPKKAAPKKATAKKSTAKKSGEEGLS